MWIGWIKWIRWIEWIRRFCGLSGLDRFRILGNCHAFDALLKAFGNFEKKIRRIWQLPCAAHPDVPCNGDSGGPLVYRDLADEPWTQVGLVSYGSGECGVGEPGVYVRVASYMDWIESHLKS